MPLLMLDGIYRIVVVFTFTIVYLSASPLGSFPHSTEFDLNSWIKYYDRAYYDRSELTTQHNRVRRSLGGRRSTQIIKFDIKGYGQTFKIRLTPDTSIFTADVIFESTKGRIDFNPNIEYKGTLEDNEDAVVQGIITKDGLFEGTISTKCEEFHVEPLSRYTTSNATTPQSFHTIVYKSSHVQDPRNGIHCASNVLRDKRQKRWLLEAEAKLPFDDQWNSTKIGGAMPPLFDLTLPIEDDLDFLLAPNRTQDYTNLLFRNVNKRAIIDPKKTTCMLYLQADHHFFQKFGTEEACIEVMTRHVQRVNAIYKTTDFNLDNISDNITFMVKRIKVHTTDALKDASYRYPGTYGVEKFLEIFSEEDYDAFCLAYMFTYRDFEMGTLGLAWTGDLKNAGGVCEKNGHYRGSMKSLNTGIVTLLNYGKHVPPAVSHVTLAHEIGHNFGSPHDPEQCTPGGEDGNFIMFARATSGDKRNNNHFSPCSLKSINPVLNFKARSYKGCFTEPQRSLCGNGVVEEGEECDCGWEEDCRDQCCFPQRRKPSLEETPCRLTPGSACSPSQGPCCTSMCQIKFGDKCRDDNGCRDESFCNGRNVQCPPSINKPNKTICNNEFVCFMGECTGSICLAYGLESCQCIVEKDDPKTKACELCCKFPGDNQACLSSFMWNEAPYDIPDMHSKPGTPCNDYSGYCDVYQICREVDPSGPLATLRKLLLSEESIATFKKFLMEYWYTVVIVFMVVVIGLAISVKHLGKHKVKTVTIMHNQKTEAVRLPQGDDGAQITVHPAIHSKLPLNKKVRNGKIKRRKKKTKPSINNNLNSPVKVSKVKTPSRTKANRKSTTSLDNPEDMMALRKTASNPAPQEPTKAKLKTPPSASNNTNNNSSSINNKNKLKKKSKKKKETIHYSSSQAEMEGTKELSGKEMVHTPLTPETDPVCKVQNWLMTSEYILPKSKSSPAGLTDKNTKSSGLQKRPSTLRPQVASDKTHSLNNISGGKDKMRLQVLYRPPFKFSVKLFKPDKMCVVSRPSFKTHRTGVLVRSCKSKSVKSKQPVTSSNLPSAPPCDVLNTKTDDIDSNIHTVQSDLEVLLSEDGETNTNTANK